MRRARSRRQWQQPMTMYPSREPAMTTWHVRADLEKSYEIRVTEALLDPGNDTILYGGWPGGRRFVVMDSAVCALWRHRFQGYFDSKGMEARFMVVPGGEESKSLDVVASIIGEMQRFGVARRHEPVIVVGGGALLDAGSFAASVYLRGVPFIRVPTTLLGYVDASVGIKTGVNFGRFKNLVGTFAAPSLVI